ncbi:hypothetical protein A5641_27600 [Mycobacterium sp. 1554424.7]|nr:hypothetical protein A5641_27600 [Mycobacterium sp. 1554424.7]
MDTIGFRDVERFIHLWCLYERGFSEGMSAAIGAVEELLRDEHISNQDRVILLALSDSLHKVKRNRLFGNSWC